MTDVVERLLAVQGQDARGVRLAIRARTQGLRTADVDEQLTVERSILITWLNRGTLHLVASPDYWWLHSLTTPPLLTGNTRRLSEEGVSPADAERGVAIVEDALTRHGPMTRSALGERIAKAGIRVQGQALIHLLFLACLRGIAVRGPMLGSEHAYALVRDWLGPPPPRIDRDVALARLAQRYFKGHGPANDRDLARWAGLPLRDVRRGIAAIATTLTQRADGLLETANRAEHVPLPPPRLLGAFDPLLLGWTSREFVLGNDQSIVTVNGIFRPFALVRGRAVATWGMPHGQVVLAPFLDLSAADSSALQLDAKDVLRFLSPVPLDGLPA
ncbi:MAG TPA: winged helix DNA-binding domain-containing protein [Mycobacteriales bacterium]|nr:winged helix DNA-binding domain-containing protein [Mycobacteriales bacterium]